MKKYGVKFKVALNRNFAAHLNGLWLDKNYLQFQQK